MQLFDQIERFFFLYGYLTIFLASLVEISPAGWTIPGGLILAAGGFYAYSGGISLYGVVLAGWLGAWITFVLAYILGKSTGFSLVKRFKQEKNAERAKALLLRHGPVILTTSLLANLTRFWVAFIAGSQKYPFLKFLFYSGAASLTWTSLMVIAGFLAGIERRNIEEAFASVGILAWFFIILAIVIIYLKARGEFKKSVGGK